MLGSRRPKQEKGQVKALAFFLARYPHSLAIRRD